MRFQRLKPSQTLLNEGMAYLVLNTVESTSGLGQAERLLHPTLGLLPFQTKSLRQNNLVPWPEHVLHGAMGDTLDVPRWSSLCDRFMPEMLTQHTEGDVALSEFLPSPRSIYQIYSKFCSCGNPNVPAALTGLTYASYVLEGSDRPLVVNFFGGSRSFKENVHALLTLLLYNAVPATGLPIATQRALVHHHQASIISGFDEQGQRQILNYLERSSTPGQRLTNTYLHGERLQDGASLLTHGVVVLFDMPRSDQDGSCRVINVNAAGGPADASVPLRLRREQQWGQQLRSHLYQWGGKNPWRVIDAYELQPSAASQPEFDYLTAVARILTEDDPDLDLESKVKSIAETSAEYQFNLFEPLKRSVLAGLCAYVDSLPEGRRDPEATHKLQEIAETINKSENLTLDARRLSGILGELGVRGSRKARPRKEKGEQNKQHARYELNRDVLLSRCREYGLNDWVQILSKSVVSNEPPLRGGRKFEAAIQGE
jgi:hypothetical protein